MPSPGFPASWGLSVHLRETPVVDDADMLRLFPRWFGEGDSATRDAMVGAAREAWTKFASKQAAYAASSDPRYAVGAQLDLIGGPDRPRAESEDDEEYRARLLSDEDIATPVAILAAIDRILEPLTSKQAYYYERPNDDAFIYSKATVTTNGTYVNAKQPIRKSKRFYDERGRCKPRHLFLFKQRRNAHLLPSDKTVTSTAPAAAFRIRYRVSDDTTAPGNAHGHGVIGLPAFIQPGRSLSNDIAVSVKPTPPLAYTTGALTPAAAQKAVVLASVFSKASTATRAASGKPTPSVYRKTTQPDVVAGKIKALLAQRAMAPVKFTLLFDPTL